MELEGRNFVVTGGAGFIGSHVVDRLCRLGPTVVIDDLSTGKLDHLTQALDTGRTTFVEGSILDDHALEEAMRGVEVVIHMAVRCLRVSFRNPMDVHEVNSTGTLKALMAAEKAGAKRFIYVSS